MSDSALLTHLKTAYLIAQWIALSSSIILFNRSILTTTFPLPCTLVLMHMSFAAACAAVWKWLGWIEVPHVTARMYLLRFVPIGMCFAASLTFGNAAYLFISVAFVQMLKALADSMSEKRKAKPAKAKQIRRDL